MGGPQPGISQVIPKLLTSQRTVPSQSRLQNSPASRGPRSSGTVPVDVSKQPWVGLVGGPGAGSAVDRLFSIPYFSGFPAVCFVPPCGGSRSCGTVGDARVKGCSCWGDRCLPPGSSSCATGFGRLLQGESAAFSGIINDDCRKEELLLSCLLFHQPRSLFSCSAARYPASLSIKSLHLV